MTSCRLTVITVLLAGVVPCHIAAASERFPDSSPHSERFVIGSGGTRLQLLDWGGSGPLLLFLAGLGQTAHIFDSLAPQFRDRYHVVGLTRRGHGRSDAPAGQYDLDTLMADVAIVVTGVGRNKVTLVGHSFAGIELTSFAMRHPDLVDRLIYLEAAYDYSLMPKDSDDPVSVTPGPDDLASLEAGKRWFERAFGFWHEAIGADANDVNVRPDGTMKLESMREDVAASLWRVMTTFRPDYTTLTAPILAVYAVSETHPMLPRDAPADKVTAANTFWRTAWRPYQRASIAQLLDARVPTTIVVLRDTQHLCFLRPDDERQVVRAMRSGALPPKLGAD